MMRLSKELVPNRLGDAATSTDNGLGVQPMIGPFCRLGELLVQRGVITNLQLQVALAAQQSCGRRLGRILVERGFASDWQIADALAEQFGLEFLDASTLKPSPKALKLLSPELALRHGVLPISIRENALFCVTSNPIEVNRPEVTAFLGERPLEIAIVCEQALEQAIRRAYHLVEEVESRSNDAPAPERFHDLRLRRQVGTATQYDALDSLLERPVSLIADVQGSGFRERVKKLAQTESPYISQIRDYIEFGGMGWAVMPRLEGENLAHALRSTGPRSMVESAQIVARVAEVCDSIQQRTGGCGLILAENVMITSTGVTLVPFAGGPSAETEERDEVVALGNLLRICMLGVKDEADAALTIDSAPERLRCVLERCNPFHPETFVAAIQVAHALASCHWRAGGATQVAGSADRDALLEQSTSPHCERQSFWSRLFGLGRQEAA